ncbi:SH3 domain-containing protein [Senegalia massiliensis]|uniref:SH3b domain-containing protein n=1 Tax=Senegalia massiliensis TaxID=1720316 RepID=A0A845R382_9CLOT|nr:SH3 domain-containing protein [Senegalia massiliensis]NBI08146.1 hypothetical protein [Senegalia massiliensis]
MKGKVLILTSGMLVLFAASNGDVKEESQNKFSEILSPRISYATGTSIKDVKVTTQVLNVRQKPTTNSKRLSQVRVGQVYTVYDQSGSWYKIRTGSITGWIHGDYVMAIPTKNYPEIKVTATRLNVRLKPTINSYRISQVSKGQKFKPIDEQNGWYKINTGKVTGWVHGDYVQKASTEKPDKPKPPTGTDTELKVTAVKLNVRTGPSTSYRRISQVSKGQKFKAIDEKNGWYKINTGKVTGWVHGGYVEKIKVEKPTEPENPDVPDKELPKEIIIDTPILNVRTGPSTNYTRIFQVYEGRKYKPLDEKNGWYKIDTGKLTGWIHGGYVKKIEGETEPEKPEKPKEELEDIIITKDKEVTYINDTLNIKVEAVGSENVEYEYLVKVPNGEFTKLKNYSTTNSINYTPKNSGTYTIKVNARIKGTTEVISKQITHTVKDALQQINISKDKQKDTYINVPVTITALSDMGNVEYEYFVKRNDGSWKKQKDYSLDNTLVFTPTQRGNYIFRVNARIKGTTRVVTSEIAHSVVGNIIYQNINYSKSFQDFLLTQMNKNPQTDKYGYGWTTANLPDVDKYLNPENFIQNSDREYSYDIIGQLKITTPILNVRESNTTSTPVVDQVEGGQVYTILGEKDGWYQINTGKAAGWIHGGYVSTSYRANSNTSLFDKMTVTASVLNVRESYTTSTSVIDQVKYGEVYKPIEEHNGWYKIDTGKVVGWVHGGYLKGEEEAHTVSRGETGNLYSIKVDAAVLNVRNKPSESGSLLSRVKADEIYIVLGEQNGWYKIKVNGIVGWVSGDYTSNSNKAPQEMYQFLVLSGSSGLDASQLNNILKGKGILEGKGAAFIEASRKYNINEIYLISHALLETGYGKSTLATGVKVNGKIVYNMYGIGAYDSNPIGGGSQYAYNSGWFTPEQAIIGGAKFISEKYVNNPNYKQDTLYKMKWNPDSPGVHQYATDIGWASKQTRKIKELYELCDDYTLRFEIPKYGVKN